MPIYKCEKCEYQTKIKRLINNHLNKKRPCKTEIVLMNKADIKKPVKEPISESESDESECEPVEPVKQIKQIEPPIKQIEPPIKQIEPPIKQLEPSIKKTEPPIKKTEPPIKQIENPYLSFFNNQNNNTYNHKTLRKF
jgi:septal ring factor EnvC (AmiA/AmiB activator)